MGSGIVDLGQNEVIQSVTNWFSSPCALTSSPFAFQCTLDLISWAWSLNHHFFLSLWVLWASFHQASGIQSWAAFLSMANWGWRMGFWKVLLILKSFDTLRIWYIMEVQGYFRSWGFTWHTGLFLAALSFSQWDPRVLLTVVSTAHSALYDKRMHTTQYQKAKQSDWKMDRGLK